MFICMNMPTEYNNISIEPCRMWQRGHLKVCKKTGETCTAGTSKKSELAYRVCGTECKSFAGFRRHCRSHGQYQVSVILSTTLILGWQIDSHHIVTLSACGWVINTFAYRLAMRFRFKCHRFVRKMNSWSCGVWSTACDSSGKCMKTRPCLVGEIG